MHGFTLRQTSLVCFRRWASSFVDMTKRKKLKILQKFEWEVESVMDDCRDDAMQRDRIANLGRALYNCINDEGSLPCDQVQYTSSPMLLRKGGFLKRTRRKICQIQAPFVD